MERLLVLRLNVHGCSAEALLNGVSMGTAGPAGAVLCVPVHEYLIDGANEVSLVIRSPGGQAALAAQKRRAEGVTGAQLRLLLPRVGQICSDLSARTVAELDWAVEDGEVFAVPHTLTREAMIPIKFPRWRWLDAPRIDDMQVHKPLIVEFVQSIIVDLLRGDAESFLGASRVRLEELAVAYQQPVADVVNRLRSRLHLLYATKALKMEIPAADDIVLKACAYGRMIECLDKDGRSIFQTAPADNGESASWPSRIAVVNGRCLILR